MTRSGVRSTLVAAAVSAAAVASVLVPATPSVAGGTRTTAARTRIGSVTVSPCPDLAERAVCGSVRRPWDPTGAVPGTTRIGFAFVPASDTGRVPLGTVVGQEGGPGYPSTGSLASYAELFAPLLGRRNLLTVDQRGTGRSGPIDCPELQDLSGPYAPAAGRCAARLGPRAHLYGTDLAADDLAAVVAALHLGRVDLYGDSYGTFFAQTFAGRHPDLLRSLVLDAAYPTFGEDAWYDTQAPALRRSLATVCRGSAWCRRAGGSSTRRFDRLVDRLRRRPLTGRAPGADVATHRTTLTPAQLALVAYNATYVPTTYRELDAAVRAAAAGDPLPLLRLSAEADFPGGGVDAAADYSEGLDAAVSCRDYPQLFDLTAPPADRERALAAAITAKEREQPDVYAPFTVREYLASGWSTVDWCTRWPAPPDAYRPAPPRPAGGRYAAVPTLVLSGTLDTITTPAEGRLVADRFPRGTQVLVPGGLHVTALGDQDGCASRIVRDFVRSAAVGDTSCTRRLTPLRTAPPFWRRTTDATPVRTRGHGAPRTAGRAAAAAVATGGDALARWFQTLEVEGLGLRGGRWSADDGVDVVTLTLDRYRFTEDLAVSGTIRWDRRSGVVVARLTLAGAPAVSGRVTASWDSRRDGARARVSGRIGGHRLTGTVLAP